MTGAATSAFEADHRQSLAYVSYHTRLLTLDLYPLLHCECLFQTILLYDAVARLARCPVDLDLVTQPQQLSDMIWYLNTASGRTSGNCPHS